MNTRSYLFLWTTATLLFAACNSSQTSTATDSTGHRADTSNKEVATSTALKLKDDHLNAIVPFYLDLSKALTDEDATGAQVAAAAMELGLNEVKGGQGAALAKAAAELTAAADIESQRKLFSAFSDGFIALLKQTGMAGGELFIVHCPMAMNNTGANWISATKTVRNPYYGESMLTCGSVKETLK